MKIEKPILHFIIALCAISLLSVVNATYNLLGGATLSLCYFCCITLFLYASFKLLNDFTFESRYFKSMFILLMIYHFVIIVRGMPTNYTGIKTSLETDYLFWPFLIPLFVFFDKKVDTLVQLSKVLFYVTIAFVIISAARPGFITTRLTAESFIPPFAFGAGFLLMNARYLSTKKTLICLFVCLVAVLCFTYLARRNAIITYAGFMFAALFLFIKDLTLSKFIKLFPLVAGIIILGISYIDKIPATFTAKIVDRASEDTRSGVFDAYFLGMKENMVFGKGMSGTYYCPFIDMVTDDGLPAADVIFRGVIENGYLQLILKGGYVETVLYVMVLLPAAYLGTFRSSNRFSRSCGVLIALWLIDMSIFGLPRLVLQYIFVWISVGICYQESFREIPDEEFYNAFKKVGLK